MKHNRTFSLRFSYALDNTVTITLQAEVELHHSSPTYIVKNIHSINSIKSTPVLPDLQLKAVMTDGKIKWLHVDSGDETLLSKIVGKNIEASQEVELTN